MATKKRVSQATVPTSEEFVAIRTTLQTTQEALRRLENRQLTAKNSSTTARTPILPEIIALRNTLQLCLQASNRMEHRELAANKKVTMAQRASAKPTVTSQRTLINKIFNGSPKKRICLRHREYGSAVSPSDCPGHNQCSFVPSSPPKNRAMRRLEKFKIPATASTDSIAVTTAAAKTNQISKMVAPTEINTGTPVSRIDQLATILTANNQISTPQQSMAVDSTNETKAINNPIDHSSAPLPIPWTELADMHDNEQTNGLSMTEEMEQDLLDVSDSD